MESPDAVRRAGEQGDRVSHPRSVLVPVRRRRIWRIPLAAVTVGALVATLSVAQGRVPTPRAFAAGEQLSGFDPVPSTQLGASLSVFATSAVDQDGTVHVVWRQRLAGTDLIVHRSSTDGGVTWAPSTIVSEVTNGSSMPSLVAVADALYIGYLRYVCDPPVRCGYIPVLSVASLDGNVVESFVLSEEVVRAEPIAVASDGQGVVAAWRSFRDGVVRATAVERTGDEHRRNAVDDWLPGIGLGVWAGGDTAGALVAVHSADARVRLSWWSPGKARVTARVDLDAGEIPIAATATAGRAVLVTSIPRDDGGDVAGRLDPAQQTVAIRVRTWRPALGGNPGLPRELGVSPSYPNPNVEVAAADGRVVVAFEDSQTRAVATVSSLDGGETFGPPSIVAGSAGAERLGLTVARERRAGEPTARFSWSVADRYAPDPTGDLRPQSTPLTATPQATVTLDGCASTAATTLQSLTRYSWTIDGVAVDGDTECRITRRLTANADHTVVLEVAQPDGATHRTEQIVDPKDLLIVSLGDSVASGEGNPTVPATLVGDPTSPADIDARPEEWVDPACHRSATAGPAQAARRLETVDRHSTITFIHLACSGASIMSGDPAGEAENPVLTGGLLDPYDGIEPLSIAPDETTARPSQLDQLQALLGGSGRDIDALFLSIGANDVHFSQVVEECIKSRVDDRLPCDQSGTARRFGQRLAALPDRYITLADALSARFDEIAADPSRVMLTEYFDPTTDSDGAVNMRCIADSETVGEVADKVAFVAGLLAEVAPDGPIGTTLDILEKAADLVAQLLEGGLVTDTEALWARNNVVGQLNSTARSAAMNFGWTFVDGIAGRFARHGYCADDGEEYVVRLGQSLTNQFDPFGAFHPNAAGHRVYADALFRRAANIALPRPTPPPTSSSSLPVPEGGLGVAALSFTLGEDEVDQALYVANLVDEGTEVHASEVRVVDRVVAPPASYASTWGRGQPLAMTDTTAVITWHEVDTAGAYNAMAAAAFVGRPDVAVQEAWFVQAADRPDRLAAGKQTVVRARIEVTGVAATIAVPIRVVVTGANSDVPIIDDARTFELEAGANDVVLPAGALPLPEPLDAWQVRVEVTDPGDPGPDLAVGSNDWFDSDVVTVAESRPMRILVAPIAGTGATCADAAAVARRTVPYARAVLAVPQAGLSASFGGTALTAPGGCPALPATTQDPEGVRSSLNSSDRLARLAGVDAVVGVVAPTWLQTADPPAWGIALVGSPGAPMRGLILEAGVYDNVLAHELTHTFGVNHETRPSSGLRLPARTARGGTDYMAATSVVDMWVDATSFDASLEALSSSPAPAPAGAGPAVRVSGTISIAGSAPVVTLDPWISAPSADNFDGPSNLEVRQLAGGVELRVDPAPLAEVDFSSPVPAPPSEPDSFVFSHAVELDPAATSIEIVLDGDVVATRAVSASTPEVSITAPVGGSQFAVGSTIDASWTASDLDGGVLSHSVLISGDGGATWQPLATDLADSSFSFVAPQGIDGDDVVLRVVTTDGVRSAAAVSQPFAVRSVTRGPERVAYVATVQPSNCPSGGDLRCTNGIRTMNPDGGDDRLVVPYVVGNVNTNRGTFRPHDPDWSPDGRRIAFAAYASVPSPTGVQYQRDDLYVADADGTGVRRVTGDVIDPRDPDQVAREDTLLGYTCPDWSPDGSRISALARVSSNDSYVVSMAADGSDLRFHGRVWRFQLPAGCPRWSPDGSTLALAMTTYWFDAGDDMPARPDPWNFSYDGTQNNHSVVVAWPTDIMSTSSTGTVLATVQLVGSVDNDRWVSGASWLPDGSGVLVGIDRNGLACGIVRIDGGGQQRVLNCPDNISRVGGVNTTAFLRYAPTAPQVAPDGRIMFGMASQPVDVVNDKIIVPTMCTIPGDSDPGAPTGLNPIPAGSSCVVGPGVTQPLPLLGNLPGKIDIDWSAGPVIDDPGGAGSTPLLVDAPADAGGPYTVDEDTDLVLDASASTLAGPDAVATWDLDDDGSFDDAEGFAPTVRFADPGTRRISVRVVAGAATATDDADVTVAPLPPTIPTVPLLEVLASSNARLGPITFDDPGEAEHVAWFEIAGERVDASVDGNRVTGTATFTSPGSTVITLVVCDAGEDPCARADVPVEVVARPVFETISPATIPVTGGRVVVTGRHLAGVTSVDVGGVAVGVDALDGVVAFDAPSRTAGIVAVTSAGVDGELELRYADRRARPRSLSTPMDVPLVIDLVADDVDTGVEVPGLVHAVTTPPEHGVLSEAASPDPLAAADPPSAGAYVGGLVYTPAPGFVGFDRFVVAVDGDDHPATITIRVGNQTPVAGSDSVRVQAGQVQVLDGAALLANDNDPDGTLPSVSNRADRVESKIAGLRLAGVYALPSTIGTVWLDADGVLRFDAPATAQGTTTFVYAVADPDGGLGLGQVQVELVPQVGPTTAPPTTVAPTIAPPTTAAPPTAPATTVPNFQIPRTGSDIGWLVRLGWWSIAVGFVLVLARRLRRPGVRR